MSEVLNALKRLPTNIAGGPVDLSNLLLGLISGKGLQGLSKNPKGGSEHLASLFKNTSKGGAVQQATELLTSMASPAKAVMVPAALVKSQGLQNLFAAAVRKGASAEQAFEGTGIYKGPVDGFLRAVVSDAGAKLKKGDALIPNSYNPDLLSVPFLLKGQPTLGDVLEHPELYKAMPGLEKTRMAPSSSGNRNGSYSPARNEIEIGSSRPADFLNTLLHEAQHAIQTRSGFAGGGNPKMFEPDRGIKNLALKKLEQMSKSDDPDVRGMEELLSRKFHLTNYKSKQSNKTFDEYENLAGEAESRAVQAMQAKKDFDALPLKHYDTPEILLTDPKNLKKVPSNPDLVNVYLEILKAKM